MSEIDIERLKVDESLWPEGMTHYCPEARMFYRDNYPQGPCCIPRPAKTEWVDGLPVVGTKCEIKTRSTSEWLPVTIKYISPQGVVAETESGLDAFISCTNGPEYRPIKSGAERLKDELAALCKQKFNQQTSSSNPCLWEQIASAILSKYNLTPKDDQ
jgi:hypothetical protein